MGLAEDVAEIGRLIDTFDALHPFAAVFEPDDDNTARVFPSTLTEQALFAGERELGVQFPPGFRAYLLARCHPFDQLLSQRYREHLVLWPEVPSDDPLRGVRWKINDWRAVLGAGYIPFAQWGDGYGPMCFDTARRAPDGECPVVWIDHDELHQLETDTISLRTNIEPLARPLYANSREMIFDLFALPHGTNQ